MKIAQLNYLSCRHCSSAKSEWLAMASKQLKAAADRTREEKEKPFGDNKDDQTIEIRTVPRQKLSERSKERPVPASRLGRFVSFGSLAAGLGIGALESVTKRSFGFEGENGSSNVILTEANAQRIVETLCKVRGAALKIGQMMSMTDETLVSPQLQKVFERVRQSADFMPSWQMQRVIEQELGSEWRDKFQSFETKPFAAASIGQVHRAVTKDNVEVAVKIQYPGVAEGIESDIKNLTSVLKIANLLPKGLFIENIMRYARKELAWEVNYIREAECAKRYRNLILENMKDDSFYVPKVYEELSTRRIFTTEFINGIPIDKLDTIRQSTQQIKNKVAERILKLTLKEVFEFRFMQTDPNWSNFFYDPENDKISLLDFGATREYSKEFVDKYMKVIEAAASQDTEAVIQSSLEIGFLTGYESKLFERAHTEAIMVLGEAFSTVGDFDFSKQSTIEKIRDLMPVMLKYRLTPPPEEIYSLHRKLSGVFLMFTKLKVNINCRNIYEEIRSNYKFDF